MAMQERSCWAARCPMSTDVAATQRGLLAFSCLLFPSLAFLFGSQDLHPWQTWCWILFIPLLPFPFLLFLSQPHAQPGYKPPILPLPPPTENSLGWWPEPARRVGPPLSVSCKFVSRPLFCQYVFLLFFTETTCGSYGFDRLLWHGCGRSMVRANERDQSDIVSNRTRFIVSS